MAEAAGGWIRKALTALPVRDAGIFVRDHVKIAFIDGGTSGPRRPIHRRDGNRDEGVAFDRGQATGGLRSDSLPLGTRNFARQF